MTRTASIAITAVLSACAPSERGPYDAKTGGTRSGERSSTARAEGGAVEHESEERPGLGTEWGETRASRVSRRAALCRWR
jgi:hypothetical protein